MILRKIRYCNNFMVTVHSVTSNHFMKKNEIPHVRKGPKPLNIGFRTLLAPNLRYQTEQRCKVIKKYFR